jgi:acyl transferase domain-containing protein
LDELARGLKHYLAHEQAHSAAAEDGRPIPIFTGNLDEDRTEMEVLVAGSLGGDLLRLLLAENNLEKLALYWAKGGKIPWAALHEDGPFRMIAVPKYPFARERYWVQANVVHQPGEEDRSRVGDEQPSRGAEEHGSIPHDPAVIASGDDEFAVHPEYGVFENMQRYLVWFLCKETGLIPEQIKPGKGLRSYGVDSIVSSRLMRGFEKFFQVRVTGREMLEHGSVESLVAYLAGKVEAMNGHTHTAQPEPGNATQARAEYMDAQVIEALEQLEVGTLDLEAVQRLIGR